MQQLVRTTLNLQQFRCRKCGRFFYIDAMDRSSLDLDFGCPYGCDDNGRHIRNMSTEVTEVTEAKKHKQPDRIRDRRIVLNLCVEEFEMSVGRKPKNQAEFDQWTELAEKGLLNGHIDWDILYECTCDAFCRQYGGDA